MVSIVLIIFSIWYVSMLLDHRSRRALWYRYVVLHSDTVYSHVLRTYSNLLLSINMFFGILKFGIWFKHFDKYFSWCWCQASGEGLLCYPKRSSGPYSDFSPLHFKNGAYLFGSLVRIYKYIPRNCSWWFQKILMAKNIYNIYAINDLYLIQGYKSGFSNFPQKVRNKVNNVTFSVRCVAADTIKSLIHIWLQFVYTWFIVICH